MTGIKQFEQLCKETDFKWELIEDETAKEAARVKYETMWSSYNALKLEVIANSSNVLTVNRREMKQIEDVFLRYAPAGAAA